MVEETASRAFPLVAWTNPALWLVESTSLTWESAGCGWLMGYWLPSGFLLSCTQEVWFHVPLEIIFCGGEKYSFSCQRNILVPTMAEKLTTSTKWNLLNNVSRLCSSFQVKTCLEHILGVWTPQPPAAGLLDWSFDPKQIMVQKMSLLLLHTHSFTHCCV